MTRFIAIYQGATVGAARLVALSADPLIVGEVVQRLGADSATARPEPVPPDRDRMARLRLVVRGADKAGEAGR